MPRIIKKTFRKKLYKKKPSTSMYKIAKKVLIQQSEKKYYDQNAANANIDYTGVIYNLSSIPQGDTDVSRDGDGLKLTSLQIRWLMEVGTSPNTFRIIVFQWLPATTPTVSDVLSSTYASSVLQPLSPFKHDMNANFRILHDSNTRVVDTYRPSITGKIYITTRNKKLKQDVHFNAGTTTGVNKLYMIVVSNDAAVTYPQFSYVSRVQFRDI